MKRDAGDIPVYVYTDWDAMKLLDKRRAIEVDWNRDMGPEAGGASDWATDEAHQYRQIIEFLETGKEPEDGNWRTDGWERTLAHYPGDFVSGFRTQLHNHAKLKHPDAIELHDRLIAMMRQEGTDDLWEFLKRRYKRLSGNHDIEDYRFGKRI